MLSVMKTSVMTLIIFVPSVSLFVTLKFPSNNLSSIWLATFKLVMRMTSTGLSIHPYLYFVSTHVVLWRSTVYRVFAVFNLWPISSSIVTLREICIFFAWKTILLHFVILICVNIHFYWNDLPLIYVCVDMRVEKTLDSKEIGGKNIFAKNLGILKKFVFSWWYL